MKMDNPIKTATASTDPRTGVSYRGVSLKMTSPI
jgi:hypothetical protein